MNMSDGVTNESGSNGGEQIDAVDFYWRPGCPFSMMLEKKLVKQGIPLAKKNIWDDPSAAEFVRSVASGNETVPTISVGGRSMVNPSAGEVTSLLSEVAPHLVS